MYMNTVIAAAIISFVAATPAYAAPADASIEAREPIVLLPGMHQMNVPHGENGEPLFHIGKREARVIHPELGEKPDPVYVGGRILPDKSVVRKPIQARDAEAEAHVIFPELGEKPDPVYVGGRIMSDKSVVRNPVQARDAEAEPHVIFPALGEKPDPIQVGGHILADKTAVRRPILPRDAEAEAFMRRPGMPTMQMPHLPNGRPLAVSKLAERDAADEMQVQRTRFRTHRPILPREAEAESILPLPSYLHHSTGPHRTGGIPPIMARDDAAAANDQLASLVSGLQRRSMPIEIDDEPELARRDDANDANDQLAAAVASLQRRSNTLETGGNINFQPRLTIPVTSPSQRINPLHITYGTPDFDRTQVNTKQNAKRDDAAAAANEQLAAYVSGFN